MDGENTDTWIYIRKDYDAVSRLEFKLNYTEVYANIFQNRSRF